MMKAGIIDPTLVVKTALDYACSVARMMTTTEAMIVSEPEKEGGAGGMGGMGM